MATRTAYFLGSTLTKDRVEMEFKYVHSGGAVHGSADKVDNSVLKRQTLLGRQNSIEERPRDGWSVKRLVIISELIY